MLRSNVTVPASSRRGRIAGREAGRVLAALAMITSVTAFTVTARAQAPSSPRDAYARIIDRSDAIVLGRVVDAGYHEIPVPTDSSVALINNRAVVSQSYVRISVERWIVGPDSDPVIEVRLGSHLSPTAFLQGHTQETDTRVVVYLMRSRNEWWVKRDLGANREQPSVGVEFLTLSEVDSRISAIRKEATASAPVALAARADAVVVGSIERFVNVGAVCHVDSVLSGTVTGSEITLVNQVAGDVRLGKALLLLRARPDSTWELLNDGASCYYLDQKRVAHSTAPLESVFRQVTAAHSNRDGGAKQ